MGRTVPENQTCTAGAVIKTETIGQFVQQLIDDPDIVRIQVKPFYPSDESWSVEWDYAVIELDKYVRQIQERHLMLVPNVSYIADITKA